MKQFFLSLFLSLFALSAYSVDLRQLFIDMPDSIMPLLNKNNKLDFLDYLDMDMPSVVTNSLGGKSTMKFLTDDMLSVQMTASSEMDIKLFYGKDSLVTIAVIETICGGYCDSDVTFYNDKWQPLDKQKLISMPLLDDFLDKKLMKQSEYKTAIDEMYYRLMMIESTPGSDIFTVTLTTADTILDEEIRTSIFKTTSINYRWNGKKFIRLKSH